MNEKNHALKVVVSGFPGGGTSMLTEILRQNEQLDGGFEGGFLLKDTPKDFFGFDPFYKDLINFWDITEKEVKYIIDTEDWYEVYNRLREKYRKIKNKDSYIFDKTPNYLIKLTSVLEKVPDTKCIVIIRDPRAVFWTRMKRTHRKTKLSREEWIEETYDDAIKDYARHARGYKKALDKYGSERIMTIVYEDFCQNPEDFSNEIFEFIGLESDSQEILFIDKDKRFTPIRDECVSASYVHEYREHLSEDVQNRIIKDLEEYNDLFWNKYVKKIALRKCFTVINNHGWKVFFIIVLKKLKQYIFTKIERFCYK